MDDESGESMEPKEEVPLTWQCVCVCVGYACYKAAAAADANAASTLTKVKTFRPLLHLPAYHLHARSVCAIFFYPREIIETFTRATLC